MEMPPPSAESKPTQTPEASERAALAAGLPLVVSALGFLLFILGMCRYSLSFLDEGLYLGAISHPSALYPTVTQFGYIYHPLYYILGGDIVRLRQVSVLVTFGLAATVAYVILLDLFTTAREGGDAAPKRFDPEHILLCIATAVPSMLLFVHMVVTTPSYNSLSLQALVVTMIGLVIGSRRTPAEPGFWTAAALVGIGGWLAFATKPTTAAALAVVAVVFIAIAIRNPLRFGLVAAAVAAVLVIGLAVVADGSPLRFIDRLLAGKEMVGLFNPTYTIGGAVRLDNPVVVEQSHSKQQK